MSATKRFFDDIRSETRRMTVQGSAELASALFQGQTYVPYGSGQVVDQKANDGVEQTSPAVQQERERGGREM